MSSSTVPDLLAYVFSLPHLRVSAWLFGWVDAQSHGLTHASQLFLDVTVLQRKPEQGCGASFPIALSMCCQPILASVVQSIDSSGPGPMALLRASSIAEFLHAHWLPIG